MSIWLALVLVWAAGGAGMATGIWFERRAAQVRGLPPRVLTPEETRKHFEGDV